MSALQTSVEVGRHGSPTRYGHPTVPPHPVLPPEFLEHEIARVGASSAEMKRAVAFVMSEARFDPRAYEALSPRLRRLVDLVAVASGSVSEKFIRTRTLSAAKSLQG